jgi:hypothetical protein
MALILDHQVFREFVQIQGGLRQDKPETMGKEVIEPQEIS